MRQVFWLYDRAVRVRAGIACTCNRRHTRRLLGEYHEGNHLDLRAGIFAGVAERHCLRGDYRISNEVWAVPEISGQHRQRQETGRLRHQQGRRERLLHLVP